MNQTLMRKFFDETVNDLGKELNRDLVDELKEIKLRLAQLNVNSEEAFELNQIKKELNQERIKALDLKLLQGEKA